MIHNYILGRSVVNIVEGVEGAIHSGKLAAGEKLPAIRALAKDLSVSPQTVAAAYDQLKRRGLVISSGRGGTAVARKDALGAAVTAVKLQSGMRDLAAGNPSLKFLPVLDKYLATISCRQRMYGEQLNDPGLLEYARASFAGDGILAPDITIVGGALDGLQRVLELSLRAGDRVLVEDPGYPGILDLVRALALVPIPIPVDDLGMIPGQLSEQLSSRVKAALIVPRAQNPFGSAHSAIRAAELKGLFAKYPDLLVLEDDHAGLIAGAPYYSTIDSSQGRWAIVRSVSKTLGPDLRLAFLAGDPLTIRRVEARQMVSSRWVSHILQSLVRTMLQDSSVQALVLSAREHYRSRRSALVSALAARGVLAHGVSGLNVWVPTRSEVGACQALLSRGWAVLAGERFRMKSAPGIRITISDLELEEVDVLADAVRDSLMERQINV